MVIRERLVSQFLWWIWNFCKICKNKTTAKISSRTYIAYDFCPVCAYHKWNLVLLFVFICCHKWCMNLVRFHKSSDYDLDWRLVLSRSAAQWASESPKLDKIKYIFFKKTQFLWAKSKDYIRPHVSEVIWIRNIYKYT